MYNEGVCSRCGSPRKISNTYTQMIEMLSGASSSVEISQIICTNSDCQKKFDSARAEEISRSEARKMLKKEQDETRKKNVAANIAKARLKKIASNEKNK